MTREELRAYAKALDETGVRFCALRTDNSGNVRSLEPLPWEAAIVQILRRTGWKMTGEAETDTPVLRMER